MPSLPYIPVFEDLEAPHQIVIRLAMSGTRIAVSCTCLERMAPSLRPALGLEARPRWDTGEAVRRWKQHAARYSVR